ncbi:MAG TPA: bifunctional diaminohydroxyphosphoribosylaminopyrimidine deaminase/5-amino-6-(5-phosphoribosylamino)uracil reductase RibD, partial [Roseimicrobium sp.]|nr:bifunctional diaminohydroxyphosphoribosylaminopyrimidine deaminase/5-amino-6-(5-phosphoribosylamino)uracil reductase RibD [Roseimicrobium sp.]
SGSKAADDVFMRQSIRLALRAKGFTSPNPLVGAVLVRKREIIGKGWHHRAGEPHAEIEALRHAAKRGISLRGATLYVTLEPCCTHGRTPPCTDAIIAAGISRVVVGAPDPNPRHAGRGFDLLRKAGIKVVSGVMATECDTINAAFNHWIVQRKPLVTVKAAMTLDGKIATADGESKWITGIESRRFAMKLRQEADAILVGINTVLADNPSLTCRKLKLDGSPGPIVKPLRRIILDSRARTPLSSAVVTDAHAALTTVVVGPKAPAKQIAALQKRVRVLKAPEKAGRLDLKWLLTTLGKESVTSLLVEGGGEVVGSFVDLKLAHRVAFFYGPKVLGGAASRRGVAGQGAVGAKGIAMLSDLRWRKLGGDLLLTARIG